MGYVFDAPIHYIVLNEDDNQITISFIRKFIAILDQIESSEEGPGVVVTIGTGKHFSTGFDMGAWISEPENYYPGMDELRVLLDRLLRLSLPSLCVFNGNAMAGGYFFGCCHDMRIMNGNRGRICLTEIYFSGFLTPPLMQCLQAKLTPSAVHKLHMGASLRPDEAIKDRIIDDIYSDEQALMKMIKNYAARYAELGRHRFAIKMNKTN